MLKGRLSLIFLLIILVNISLVSAEVAINEIMYDPNHCSDSDCEWIELYNNGSEIIYLNDWTIDGNNFDNVSIILNEYIIIARQLIDTDDDSESFECVWGNCDGVWNLADGNYTAVDGNFILSNDPGDTINLTNGTYSNIISYLKEWGADGDGNSLQLVNSEWCADSPTPGTENSCEENETEQEDQNQTQNQTTESSNLHILDAQEEAEFGELIKIKINAYRGDTDKYAIYLWIEDLETGNEITEKLTMHLKDKSTNYTMQLPLQINPNCDEEYGEGNYTIMLEGLNNKTTQNITIEGNNYELCTIVSSISGQGIEYEIDRPSNAVIGKEFSIGILIKNNQNTQLEPDIWSYVYRDNKCYSNSNNEQANLKHTTVSKNSKEFIQLKNIVEGAEEGVYKLKIVVKQGTKEKEFVNDILLVKSEEEKLKEMIGEKENILNVGQPSEQEAEQAQEAEGITGKATYLSKTDEIKDKALWIFAFLCLLIALYFIVKKQK